MTTSLSIASMGLLGASGGGVDRYIPASALTASIVDGSLTAQLESSIDVSIDSSRVALSIVREELIGTAQVEDLDVVLQD